MLLEFLVAINGPLDGFNLITRHVSRDLLAVFAALMVVVRTVGTLPDDGQGATFHLGDFSDLLQERLRSHAESIFM